MKKRLCFYSGNCKSDIIKIRELGYDGIVFSEFDEEGEKFAQSENLETYSPSEFSSGFYCEDPEKAVNFQKPTLVGFNGISEFFDKVKELPRGTAVILPFESGQEIERDGATVSADFGAVAVSEPSDKLKEIIGKLHLLGLKVYVRTYLSGRTDEFATVPYIPSMMQWMLRKQSCDSLDCDGFLETGYYGFSENPVAEYISRLYASGEDGGRCLAKYTGEKYGKDAQKMIMAFKYASDGANYILPERADVVGPFAFSSAYPLTCENIYGFPFNEKDVTLQIDSLKKAQDSFLKASSQAKDIDGDVYAVCAFIACTLETACNAKKWYRRLDRLNRESQKVRKKFLMEQMVAIGKREIENAIKCGEIIFLKPSLTSNGYEDLCGIEKLEAKIKLTEQAIAQLKIKIQQL